MVEHAHRRHWAEQSHGEAKGELGWDQFDQLRGWQPAGNVTIPANQTLPQAGDVVEVRYLYAFPENGVLFQPVCLGVRDDITAAECGTSQLKFKPSDTDEDA